MCFSFFSVFWTVKKREESSIRPVVKKDDFLVEIRFLGLVGQGLRNGPFEGDFAFILLFHV